VDKSLKKSKEIINENKTEFFDKEGEVASVVDCSFMRHSLGRSPLD